MSLITPIPDPHTYAARFAVTVAALREQFGRRAAVTPGEALAALPGASPDDPCIAAKRRRARGTYPFRTVRLGGELAVLLVDIATALLEAPSVVDGVSATRDEYPAPQSHAPESGTRRRRGRPRKTDAATVPEVRA